MATGRPAMRTAPLLTSNGSYSASEDTRSRTSTDSRQTAVPTCCRSRRLPLRHCESLSETKTGPALRHDRKPAFAGKAHGHFTTKNGHPIEPGNSKIALTMETYTQVPDKV